MRSLMLTIGVVVAVAGHASAARARSSALLTHCVASVTATQGTGLTTVIGNCNGRSTYMTGAAGSILGRLGGLSAAFVGTGVIFAGRIGSWRTTYQITGRTILGHYGSYQLRFGIVGNAVVGHVGTAPVKCAVLRSPSWTVLTCLGSKGGAEALIPLLAHIYAER